MATAFSASFSAGVLEIPASPGAFLLQTCDLAPALQAPPPSLLLARSSGLGCPLKTTCSPGKQLWYVAAGTLSRLCLSLCSIIQNTSTGSGSAGATPGCG